VRSTLQRELQGIRIETRSNITVLFYSDALTYMINGIIQPLRSLSMRSVRYVLSQIGMRGPEQKKNVP
jgi:hypothetical protein